MGELVSEEWLQAQNCLLGAALIDPELVPRVVTELTAEDFYGNGLLVYKAMADLFRQSKTNKDVDAVAVAHYLGDTADARMLVAQLMGCSPMFSEIDRYFATVRRKAKLLRLQALGDSLSTARTMEDAIAAADDIASQLVDRPGMKGYEPAELLDSFVARHQKQAERIEWGLRVVGDYIRAKKGNFFVLGAEPSGGKTAFALEQMWTFSRKHRVLFISLETDEDILREMVYDVKSCGFICGERDLENWNPLEIFGLLHGTKPYFGELGCLVPKYTVDDIRNFAKLSLNNLYHEICHRYIHAGPEKSEARLSNCYKSVFFILQIVHYLRMGEFVPTKPMLLDRLTGMDAEILRYAMNGENFAWRDQFTLLFAWCQKTMSEI